MNLINSQSLYTIIQRLTILGKDKFIEEEEARYARQIVSLADEIVENDIELVLLAGPSGSGKTTTAHNLRKELMCRLMGEGHYVYCLSMDDWYMSADRYTMPVDEEGQPDYESPDCLDVPRLNRDLNDLFAGREVSLPTYNFITRRSVESGAKIELKKGDVVIMEGLHALNPMIHFPDDTLRSLRVYVSPADVIVDETRGMELSNQYIRLCRRIYRDRDQRGSSEEETIERSRSVNRGERLYIAPFLNNVGVWRVDTLLGYELFIHRRELPEEKELRVVPLSKITRFDIPEGSILREFYKV
ncbi:nucleoside kinase [bacterium 210917-DFI.7.65]|nr:nucleoside kinase [bacterium 210917-DFI.7.65]